MVRLKIILFKYLDYLDKISDNCCSNNGKKYINFDEVNSSLASVDCLIIEDIKNFIVFIEFKKFDDLNNNEVQIWINNREKIQQILLKGYESYFVLKNICKKVGIFDEFRKIDKRFIFVYRVKNSKKKIKEHFKNKLKRLNIVFDEVLVLDCKNFFNLLQRIDNVF